MLNSLHHVPLALFAVAACGGEPELLIDNRDPLPIDVMTYNLGNAGATRADNMAAFVSASEPDFLAIQECGDCPAFLARLPDRYRLATEATSGVVRAGVAIIYDGDRWQLEEPATIKLGDNDDGFGERVAGRGLFVDRETSQGHFIYSTHWCVSTLSEDDDCDGDRHVDYARAITADIANAAVRAPAVVLGDLNVFEGFEDAPAIDFFEDRGFVDVFRAVEPDANGRTFIGNPNFPPGRLDYIFATSPVDSLAAAITELEPTETNDHYPVTATIVLR